ncbi:MAG TPA: hypothetical protein VGC69_16460 [Bordetella sp.]
MHAAFHHEVKTADSPAGLEGWRSAIARGNLAFKLADYAGAIAQYRAAHSWADALFGHIDDVDAGVAAFVVSCHNLADTYECLDRPDEQESCLCLAHEKLCAAMNDGSLAEPWRLAALRHSRRTYAELLRFLGRHPGHARARAGCALGAAGPTPLAH